MNFRSSEWTVVKLKGNNHYYCYLVFKSFYLSIILAFCRKTEKSKAACKWQKRGFNCETRKRHSQQSLWRKIFPKSHRWLFPFEKKQASSIVLSNRVTQSADDNYIFASFRYESWSLQELQSELRSRKLSISGNKVALIQRILSNEDLPSLLSEDQSNTISVWNSPFIIFWYFGLFSWKKMLVACNWLVDRKFILLVISLCSTTLTILHFTEGVHSPVKKRVKYFSSSR